MRVTHRLALVVAVVAGLVLPGPAAQAAYYNTYSDVASTPDTSGTTAVQAFAAGSKYLYSVKTGHDDTKAVIYRVNKETGARTVMRNGTDNTSSNTWLGHANDMTIVDIDGRHHLFVVTMKATGAQLVKLRYDGTTYWKAGAYKVRLSGAVAKVSGINVVKVGATTAAFLFKSGRQILRGSVPLRSSTGTVNLTRAFSLKVTGALVNGATVPDLDSYLNQGFFYDIGRKVLYYPLTRGNRSIVLVYRNVGWSTTGTRTSASDLSFRITSSKYTKFEIEGLGLSGNRLYFNTNRANAGGAHDGVHVFKGYVAS